MKKKILCLVLAMLLVLPLLASCNKDGSIESINAEASRYTTTLNVWLITEEQAVADASAWIFDGVTPKILAEVETLLKKPNGQEELNNKLASDEAFAKQYKLITDNSLLTDAAKRSALQQVWDISEAINALTKAKYKTKLNLRYFTEEKYYAAVENAFAEHEKQIAAGNTVTKNESEQTVLNEHGIPELMYPTLPGYEVDVLFIGDYDNYALYAGNQWLKDMQMHLSESALKLTTYISTKYLQSATYNGMMYALPNNHVVGEYVYLLADKEMLAEYNGQLAEYNGQLGDATLYDDSFRTYLDWVYENKTGVYPIYTDAKYANGDLKIELNYAHYWSMSYENGKPQLEPGKFSIYGDVNANKAVLDNEFLLANEAYMMALANKTHYEKTTGYVTDNASENAAVKIMRGTWQEMEAMKAEGYEVLVMQAPVVDDTEIYKSMFAIGSYTVNEKASAEIINFINTDAEVRNLLQYGVKDLNYTLATDDAGHQYVVPVEGNIYEMDVEKTGNVFLTHPASKETVSLWEYQKKQNLDMVYSAVLGMHFADAPTADAKNLLVMNALSERVAAAIQNMDSMDEVVALYQDAISVTHSVSKRDMLLRCIGYDDNPLTYTVGEETKTATVQDIGNAIVWMEQQTENPDMEKNPYLCYYAWCVSIGTIAPR